MRPRILWNSSNLHIGGGVAVAASAIFELTRSSRAADIFVVASSEVDEALRVRGANSSELAGYEVRDVRGLGARWDRPIEDSQNWDVIFTIFGPNYQRPSGGTHVTGFAQPWIVYPRNPARKVIGRRKWAWESTKARIQAQFFKTSDVLVVEHESVRQALLQDQRFRHTDIRVVSNAVDSTFFEPNRWEPIIWPTIDAPTKIACISAAYPHKNLRVLPLVKQILTNQFGLDVAFLVTLSKQEWESLDIQSQSALVNVGRLSTPQVATLLHGVDAAIFPSLLECFSATPIEAQEMGVPLLVSDLPFITETLRPGAVVFDPTSPSDIAQAIVAAHGRGLLSSAGDEGRTPPKLSSAHGEQGPASTDGARTRLLQYLRICDELAASHLSPVAPIDRRTHRRG